jgi:CBS domain-containing protein
VTRLHETTVADLMTRGPATVRDRALLEKAVVEMEALDVRHLPVVDAAGRVVGMLSDRDVRRWVGRGMRGALVSQAMTREVLVVAPETLAREAAVLMMDRKIGGLPVVDERETLVGIVTETDFLRVAYHVMGGAA